MLATRRNLGNALALLSKFVRSLKASSRGLIAWSVTLGKVFISSEIGARCTHLTLRYSIFHLVHFDLAKPLDLQEIATGGRVHRGDSVVSICFQLCNVDRADAMGLDGVNVDDEAILLRSA